MNNGHRLRIEGAEMELKREFCSMAVSILSNWDTKAVRSDGSLNY